NIIERMKKSLLFLLGLCLFTILSIIYQSCKPIRQCFILQGLSIYPTMNKGNTQLKSGDTVDWDQLLVNIDMQGQLFTCKNEQCFSLVNTAYATKLSVQEIYHDTIKSIHIESNQAYDVAHPAGTSLNDIFNVPADIPKDLIFGRRFNYHAIKSPDSTRFHELTVKVEIAGSIPYERTLPSIKIMK
ncbi:MAG: DUF5034 domain-containing protein, partial [Chitinophagaceae bacterium]|nr:DUF5034 domain-containing protein [Chitinophagaceae bacterium]